MPRFIINVVADILPQLGDQMDDTLEEIEGVLALTVAEYGSIVGVKTEEIPRDDSTPEGRLIELVYPTSEVL